MKIYRLNKEQLINRPINEVFSFFDRPENLAKITPPSLGFKILTPTPIEMKNGTIINYTVKVLGIPIHWVSLISAYNPPYRFVDEQLKGPYKFWHHEHKFSSTPEGTLIEDIVHYAIPIGPIGRILHPILIRRNLNQIFNYRTEVINAKFGK